MSDLGVADARHIFEAASALIAIDLSGDVSTSVLSVVASVIPCEMISYNEVDLATGKTYAAVFPERWVPWVLKHMPLFEAAVFDHPLVVYFAETPHSSAIRLDDVVDEPVLFATSFYSDFFDGLLGFRHQMAIPLPAPTWLTCGLALSREPGDPFTDRDVAVLNALAPHLVHCYHRAQVHRSHSSLTDTAIEEGWAVVSVNGTGHVLRIDGDPGDGIELGSELPAELTTLLHQPRQSALLHNGAETISVVTEEANIKVHAISGSDYLLLVRPGGKDLRNQLELLDFTPRQIDVAEQLLIGGTNSALAKRLGISSGTLRKHLQALFLGLDVSDRASAIARIARYAKDVGSI